MEIRRRRIHDSRRTFISLARDDGAQRDVIKSLTHPLDASDAHDSYTTFAWSRWCEEVAKLKITLRQPAEVTRLPLRAVAGEAQAQAQASEVPAPEAIRVPALDSAMEDGQRPTVFRRRAEKFGATLGAASLAPNEKQPQVLGLGAQSN